MKRMFRYDPSQSLKILGLIVGYRIHNTLIFHLKEVLF